MVHTFQQTGYVLPHLSVYSEKNVLWRAAFVGLDAGHNLERALQHIRYAIVARRGVGERHGEKCFLPGLSIRNMQYIAHTGLSPNILCGVCYMLEQGLICLAFLMFFHILGGIA